MSATRLLLFQQSSSCSLSSESHRRLRPSFQDPKRSLSSSSTSFISSLPSYNTRITPTKNFKNFVVYSSMTPGGTPIPSAGNPSGSWKGWVIGILLSVILPLYRNNLNPLLAFKKEVQTIADTTQIVLDAVEKVAEEVAEIADDLGDKLPQGKLKHTIDMVENAANEIFKDANVVEDLLHKVEKVEEKAESIICEVKNITEEIEETASQDSLAVDKLIEAPSQSSKL